MKKKVFVSLAMTLLLCSTGASIGNLAHADSMNDQTQTITQNHSIFLGNSKEETTGKFSPVKPGDRVISGHVSKPNIDVHIIYRGPIFAEEVVGKSDENGKFELSLTNPAEDGSTLVLYEVTNGEYYKLDSIIVFSYALGEINTIHEGDSVITGHVTIPNIKLRLVFSDGEFTEELEGISDEKGDFSFTLSKKASMYSTYSLYEVFDDGEIHKITDSGVQADVTGSLNSVYEGDVMITGHVSRPNIRLVINVLNNSTGYLEHHYTESDNDGNFSITTDQPVVVEDFISLSCIGSAATYLDGIEVLPHDFS